MLKPHFDVAKAHPKILYELFFYMAEPLALPKNSVEIRKSNIVPSKTIEGNANSDFPSHVEIP